MSSGEITNGQQRILAVLTLLNHLHHALEDSGRTAEVSDQVQGGRPSGRPPAGGERPDDSTERSLHIDFSPGEREVVELAQLLCRGKTNSLTGRDSRRIAEIWEFLDQDELAYRWWQNAAAMGDSDAQDYLEVLHEEVADSLAALRSAVRPRPCHAWEPDMLWRRYTLLKAVAPRCGGQVVTGRETEVEDTEVQRMVREIEDYLAHPDHVADGDRQR